MASLYWLRKSSSKMMQAGQNAGISHRWDSAAPSPLLHNLKVSIMPEGSLCRTSFSPRVSGLS